MWGLLRLALIINAPEYIAMNHDNSISGSNHNKYVMLKLLRITTRYTEGMTFI